MILKTWMTQDEADDWEEEPANIQNPTAENLGAQNPEAENLGAQNPEAENPEA